MTKAAAPQELAEILGHNFENLELLSNALCHASYAHERGGETQDNEKLEFLGDAVLDLVVGESLMESNPSFDEGELSKARASLVSTDGLADRARELQLGEFLLLGRGEEQSGGRDKDSILANALEAVIAAVYVDGGLNAAKLVIAKIFGTWLRGAERTSSKDFKTKLQEHVQAQGGPAPSYELLEQAGPAHARVFTVQVLGGDGELAQGQGKSKRIAEQAAAANALLRLASETG